MTGPCHVAVLDPMPDAMQAKVRAIAGDLDLRFPASPDIADFAATVRGADVIVVRGLGLSEEILRGSDAVRLVHKWGTGVDNIPLDVARELNVPVARSPGVNAPTVADLTVGMIIAALRRIPQHDNNTRAGRWIVDSLVPGARDLNGRTVGLIGFGAIGQLVARRLTGFDCDVMYHRPSGRLPGAAARFVSMAEILETADIVSLHLPLTEATRHMIGAPQLAAMKTGAMLVNTGRGGLVDEDALIAALRSGHLAAAALDVFAQEPVNEDNPMLHMDNVVVLPHIGGYTEDNLHRMVSHWAENIRRFRDGRGIDADCIVI
jgi:D-3-phosphoglycerate dehydrogenase